MFLILAQNKSLIGYTKKQKQGGGLYVKQLEMIQYHNIFLVEIKKKY